MEVAMELYGFVRLHAREGEEQRERLVKKKAGNNPVRPRLWKS
jgi:hypothetical protein